MMSKINFFYSREQGHSLPIPIIGSPLPDNDLIVLFLPMDCIQQYILPERLFRNVRYDHHILDHK